MVRRAVRAHPPGADISHLPTHLLNSMLTEGCLEKGQMSPGAARSTTTLRSNVTPQIRQALRLNHWFLKKKIHIVPAGSYPEGQLPGPRGAAGRTGTYPRYAMITPQ